MSERPSPPVYVSDDPEGALLQVTVQPRAQGAGVHGVQDGRVKVRLQSPPAEGKANRELVQVLRRRLKVPASRVNLISGQRSRQKTVQVRGLTAAQVADHLGL